MYINRFDDTLRIITKEVTLFWFRRDLRISDNVGLFQALKNNTSVLPIFIFDTTILSKLEDEHDRRVEFIYITIKALKQELEQLGSSLCVWVGKPTEIFKQCQPKAVYCNGDYEPYAKERDMEVKSILESYGSALHVHKDQVIFEKSEVVKPDGKPYTVFTPYSKQWKSKLTEQNIKGYSSDPYYDNFIKTKPLPFFHLSEIGFKETGFVFPERKIKLKAIVQYHLTRDFPSQEGTTRLSTHIRFGTVSIRKLVSIAIKTNEIWLNELIWREFYQMILWHFPHVERRAFKAQYEAVEWRNDESEFYRWCQGQTGYPIVDAGMRELNTTGFMHNRLRMIVASFLTKHLLIDWRWGEAYFAKKLLDFDLASNNGGWQWAAGCGCDAAPYFRIFNPKLQTEKFDKELTYIRQWIPELDSQEYPKPIVNHEFARLRVLETYKKALGLRREPVFG